MRQEKQFLLDEIKEQIKTYPSFVIMSYVGLKANVMNEFRENIAKFGGNVEMVRKRMLIKAADEIGISLNDEPLPGHIGVVFTGEDSIETAKAVLKFSKDSGDSINVLMGHIDGQMYAVDEVKKLANLPSKDELRAQFLGLLEAPMAQTLATMEALLCSVIHCIENKSQKETDEKN